MVSPVGCLLIETRRLTESRCSGSSEGHIIFAVPVDQSSDYYIKRMALLTSAVLILRSTKSNQANAANLDSSKLAT